LADRIVQSIVHVNTQDKRGGAAKAAERLIEYQRLNGMDARMLVGIKEDMNGTTSIPFAPGIDFLKRDRLRQDGYLYYEYEGSHRLSQHPIVEHADLVHLHNLHGGYFHPFSLPDLTNQVPTVWTLHDMQAITGHCAHAFTCSRWMRGCGECPDLNVYPSVQQDQTAQMWADKRDIYHKSNLYIVTPSDWLKRKVEKSMLSNFPVEVIPNGVDTSLFRPISKSKVREKLKLPENHMLIGGSAVSGVFQNVWKGGMYAKAALEWLDRQSTDYTFINIGGSGNTEHPHIVNTGHISSEAEMAEWLSSLDIFLYTSIADNCPLVILEALAVGVPIVSFATGGIPELVRHHNDGYIAAYKDTQSLIEGLDLMMHNQSLRELYGSNARRQAVRNFDHTTVGSRYDRVYEKAMDRHARLSTRARGYSATNKPVIKVLYSPVQGTGYEASDTYRSLIHQTYRYMDIIVGHAEGIELGNPSDLVYVAREGYVLDPHFMEWVVQNYHAEDVFYTSMQLCRQYSKQPFFKPAGIDLFQRDGQLWFNPGVDANVVYRGEFYIEHEQALARSKAVRLQSVNGLQAKLVHAPLSQYLEGKVRRSNSGKLYIYGAGTHTQELLENVDHQAYKIAAIFDRNRARYGQKLIGYPIVNPLEAQLGNMDRILISSASYEKEIYDELRRSYKPEQLIRFYGE